jgi:uncharacterized protein (TIGR02001 family)
MQAPIDGCEVVRSLAGAIALFVGLCSGSAHCNAADLWSGSLGLTNDYLVRGISRSNDQPALQLDLSFASDLGISAGVFASNAQVSSSHPRVAEVSGYIGFAWNLAENWRSKILASHYAYIGNGEGSNYDYDEIDLDLAYHGWLHLGLEYSPNAPRFVPFPYGGWINVNQKSAEVNVQRLIVGKLSATAGLGYSFLEGPESGGYTYWSVGGAYDLRSVSLALSYVDTSAEAKALFYNAASRGRWIGTVIWRF